MHNDQLNIKKKIFFEEKNRFPLFLHFLSSYIDRRVSFSLLLEGGFHRNVCFEGLEKRRWCYVM